MNPPSLPFVQRCSFCEQGQLRVMRCRGCEAIVAVCDECELIWDNPREVASDASRASSGAHPLCPACGLPQDSWELLTLTEIDSAGLKDCLK